MRVPSILLLVFVACAIGSTPTNAQSGDTYLGVRVGPLTSALSSRVGHGVLVVAVAAKSPADLAAIKINQVIVEADGNALSSPVDLTRTIAEFWAGETIKLKVVDPAHGFTTRTVSVRLGTRPASVPREPDDLYDNSSSSVNDPSGDGIYHGFDDFNAPPARTNAPAGRNTRPPASRSGAGATPNAGGQSGALIPVQLAQGRLCRALVPAGWRIVDEEAQGRAATFASADQRMFALYAINGVNGGAARGYYGPQQATPAGNVQLLASVVANRQLQAVGLQNFMGAQVVQLQGPGMIGFGLFQTAPLYADPQGYLLLMRVALADSRQREGIAGAVASTIQCNAQFKPPAGGYAQVQPRSASSATGTSAACQAGQCSDGDLAGTYNAQLGTGYVHSATGQNYLVDPATDYHQTGPDGPGYYRQVGNTLEKLTPGWSQ